MSRDKHANNHNYHSDIDSMNTYDSRYVRVLFVMDEIVEAAECADFDNIGILLERLLSNSLELTQAENNLMKMINYPDYADHQLHHANICTSIADVCFKWSHALNSMELVHVPHIELHRRYHCNVLTKGLVNVRQLVTDHLLEHDRQFEEFLTVRGDV